MSCNCSILQPYESNRSRHWPSGAASHPQMRTRCWCLLKDTMPSMKYSCQNLASEFDQASKTSQTTNVQETQGTRQRGKWYHRRIISKIQAVGNSTEQTSQFLPQINCSESKEGKRRSGTLRLRTHQANTKERRYLILTQTNKLELYYETIREIWTLFGIEWYKGIVDFKIRAISF